MNKEKTKSARKYLTCLLLLFAFLLLPRLSFAQTLAPGAPGKDAQWASAGKQAIGTSAGLESKVWFTLQGGAMTEVYYPNVTVANVHKLEFVVVDPKTKKVETETADAAHEIKITRPDSMSFQQINTAKSGLWKITKTYTTDPERDSVLIDVQFEPKNKNLNLYVYYDPSIGNTGMGDRAYSPLLQLKGSYEYEKGTITKDGVNSVKKTGAATVSGGMASEEGNIVSTVFFTSDIEEYTNGYYQTSDGLEQLRKFGKIKETYGEAAKGNVVQMARIMKPQRFTTIISFGEDVLKASAKAAKSLEKGFAKSQAEYEKEWSDYVKTIRRVEPKYQAQFNMAAMVLRAQEDKTVRGANVASLTVPWGGGATANGDVGGGYHLVWSRDLYHVFTAYMALGDTPAANRALDFLFNIQQKEDGSFPQNSQLDGTKGWGSLQMDEVAYPLIMAYQLKRFDKKTYENHVKRAADFIVKTGPKTPQERWEEKPGYSPSTIAAEIAGLVCAAEIARKNGDETSANLYLKTADDWESNIEKWTATTNGKFGDGNYYVRLTANGKPDAGEKIELSNSSGAFLENEIVDMGFLELVRLGIKSPDDPLIVKSLKVIDAQIKVNTPNGESFYRYNHDGYGEQPDGRRWNFDGTYSGTGRLWALLAGERGQYELAICDKKSGTYWDAPDDVAERLDKKCREIPKSRLDAMLAFANEGLMIPEQIWDKAETPKNIDKQFVPELKFGEGTGSATPLAWSMAQFIRLAVNLQAGKNLDTPDVVYNRYVLGKKTEVSSQKIESDADITEVPVSFRVGLKDVRKFFGESADECETAKSFIPKGNGTMTVPQKSDPTPRIFARKGEKESEMLFAYFGTEKSVEIAGDFTGWKPCNLKFQEFSGPKILVLKFPNSARVEYKLIVDGKWITDPLNPNKVDSGVGGENSFFTMPDYQPTSWDKGETAKLDTVEINSKIYGRKNIQVYAPVSEPSAVADGLSSQSRNVKINAPLNKVQPSATADGSDRMPTLYLQDGSDYINRAKAIQIQQNLVKANKIKPFIMVFLDPKDRMKEYWANDDYAKYVATEVVPAIDAKYKTIKNRDGRTILGASLGGVTSVHAAVKYPEIFGRVGGQSSSFWIDNERVIKELETLDVKRNNFKFYFDVGTLEGADDDKKAVEILRGKGFDVTYREAETGHNWTSWRDRLADAFIALWR
jgi:glucan 1,4-alpha-glucosidase